MNDYKELISTLRTHAEYCEMPFSWMNDAYNDAANAIEQLVKERDEWKTLGSLANKRAEDYREMRRQRDKAIKERGAAVADIPTACGYCKWFRDSGEVECFCQEPCSNISGVNTMWEWRGVQDDLFREVTKKEVEHEAD